MKKVIYLIVFIFLTSLSPALTEVPQNVQKAQAIQEQDAWFDHFTDFFATLGKSKTEKKEILEKRRELRHLKKSVTLASREKQRAKQELIRATTKDRLEKSKKAEETTQKTLQETSQKMEQVKNATEAERNAKEIAAQAKLKYRAEKGEIAKKNWYADKLLEDVQRRRPLPELESK